MMYSVILNSKFSVGVTIEDRALVIKSKKDKKVFLSKKEKMALVERVANEVMDTYEEAFKKLAKC